jgi:hypothetical protein
MVVYGAKRIRSLYLPWMPGVTPKLSTTTPPKGLASLSTINDATTPWRGAFADLPASGGADRPCLAPSEQRLPLGEWDGQLRGRSRRLVRNAG